MNKPEDIRQFTFQLYLLLKHGQTRVKSVNVDNLLSMHKCDISVVTSMLKNKIVGYRRTNLTWVSKEPDQNTIRKLIQTVKNADKIITNPIIKLKPKQMSTKTKKQIVAKTMFMSLEAAAKIVNTTPKTISVYRADVRREKILNRGHWTEEEEQWFKDNLKKDTSYLMKRLNRSRHAIKSRKSVLNNRQTSPVPECKPVAETRPVAQPKVETILSPAREPKRVSLLWGLIDIKW